MPPNQTTTITINPYKLQTARRLRSLLLQRSARSLGCTWLVLIPLLVFVLCQLYTIHYLSPPPHTPNLSLPSASIEAFLSRLRENYNNNRNVSASFAGEEAEEGGLAFSVHRLAYLERRVNEEYLRVQLALASSSGSLLLREDVEQSPPLVEGVGSLKNLRTFQPLLTPREKAHLLHLFDLFSSACRTHRLPFFLLESSLVGALRHHGVIPWSDVSVTVAMPSELRWVVREVLEKNVEGVTLMWANSYRWSLRLKDTKPDPPSFSRMTYILIQFFQLNGSHVWADQWETRRLFTAEISSVFPLTVRPFEGRPAPVPCNALSVLQPQSLQQCRVFAEDLEEMEFRDAGLVPCDVLARVFPFVTRRVAMTSESSLEQVTVNGTMLTSVLVEGVCQVNVP